MRYLLAFLLIAIITVSCKDESNSNDDQVVTPGETFQSDKILFSPEVTLNSTSKNYISEWKEYQKVDEFLTSNASFSSKEILFSASDLLILTSELKDSTNLEKLETPSIKMRVNVLNNEVMRLKDMSEIPTITEEETIKQYHKVYAAFSAINSKLNDQTNQDKLNRELKNFIDEVATEKPPIFTDTTK